MLKINNKLTGISTTEQINPVLVEIIQKVAM